jgi:GNAT superfamily N-acetyltransferase
MRVIVSESAKEIAKVAPGRGIPAFEPSDFETQHAQLHVSVLGDVPGKEEETLARCSLWWDDTPQYEQHRVGLVGHYAAANAPAAERLLAEAERRLRDAGCTIAIGPMNGNTWRSYRFVTEAGGEPPFFLEPANQAEWPAQFVAAGFAPLASYFSALSTTFSEMDPRVAATEERLARFGVTIRAASPDLKTELAGIYAVSGVSFARNFLYTEISEADFAAMYQPILPVTKPELVFVAERAGQCVGYLFAIPDLAQVRRGVPVDTFIVKTVAILPEEELRGLGGLLVARAQQQGHHLGFRRCIHALMHENNVSMNISRHYASVMRKYTLYSKRLQ